jgi:hypothetical protein
MGSGRKSGRSGEGTWVWRPQRRYREIHGRFELDMGRFGRDTGDPEEVQRDPGEIERYKVGETYGR